MSFTFKTLVRNWEAQWSELVGSPSEFKIETRSFHAISILSFLILLILLPFNIWLELYPISALVSLLLVLQGFFFFISRYRNKYLLSLACYIPSVYITLIFTFYYNSGSNGPAMPLFFLTFMLLIAITPMNRHWLITLLHMGVAISLLTLEKIFPEWIIFSYRNADEIPVISMSTDRYIDLVSTYMVTISFVYFTIRYLWGNYIREHALATLRLTAIEKQNKELETLNQEKNKLFSIISHDLRSPINSLQSYLELLSSQTLNPEERKHFESALLNMTKNTSDMLYNLLTWSNKQMEGVSAELKKVELHETLSNLLEIEKAIAAKKDITLEYSFTPDQRAKADPDMLQLVIRNLVNNAIKFTHPGGKITVKAENRNNTCTISVADTGIGIDPAKQAELFQLKNRQSFGTNNERGVGLGLLLCKEFVELQQGRLWFETAGKGTTFYVSLPEQ
jgi:two-component system sensor histidine kinase/response regulator